MQRHESSLTDMSGEERRFLLHVSETGLTTFHPCRDGMIAHLLDAGLIEAEQLDAETVFLRPTPQGEYVISRLRDDRH